MKFLHLVLKNILNRCLNQFYLHTFLDKPFFEKYFNTSIISIVSMFIIYFYTPSESELIKKFTVTGYLIFIFCSCLYNLLILSSSFLRELTQSSMLLLKFLIIGNITIWKNHVNLFGNM